MWIWRIMGGLALGLGAVGLVVPVLPTTIFWIIAAVCFARSDPTIRDWIYARPGIGPDVELFVEHGRMRPAGKRAALIGMSLAALIGSIVLWGRWVPLAGSMALILVGAVIVVTRPGADP